MAVEDAPIDVNSVLGIVFEVSIVLTGCLHWSVERNKNLFLIDIDDCSPNSNACWIVSCFDFSVWKQISLSFRILKCAVAPEVEMVCLWLIPHN